MRRQLKSSLKKVLPPFFLEAGKSLFGIVPDLRFEGNFENWESAAAVCSGYSAQNIIAKVLSSTEFVLANPEFVERDGVVLEKSHPPFHLLWVLEKVLREFGELNVLDFGGALGSHYRQVRQYLPDAAKVNWVVVEQESYVKIGRRFETNELKFTASIQDCISTGYQPNIIVLSGVLQYLSKMSFHILQIGELSAKYLFIDRTPMLESDGTAFVIQRVPESIYKAMYPAILQGKQQYRELLHKKWARIVEWESSEALPWVKKESINTVQFHGMFLEKL